MLGDDTKNIVFYCQHLLGVGHLTRSLAICSSLSKKFKTTFIQGGPDVGKTLNHSNFHHTYLPPLLMREDNSQLYDPIEKKSVEEMFEERKSLLEIQARSKIDCLVIELFPFGRNKFKKEVFYLIQQVKLNNPNCVIGCSIRDILVEKAEQDKWELKVLKHIEENFDFILVHSDPKLIKFDETFSLTSKISKEIVYTGYVSKKLKLDKTKIKREKKILVSSGGGAVGFDLLKASALQAKNFPDYQFDIVLAPNLTLNQRNEVAEFEQEFENVRSHDFLHNFEEHLCSSALAINLGGYNTIMNILETNTPSVVLPYDANREQRFRATKLEKLGLISIVEIDQLFTDQFKDMIRTELDREIPEVSIDLDGSEHSAIAIEQILRSKN